MMQRKINRRKFFTNTGLATLGTLSMSPLDSLAGALLARADDHSMIRRNLTPTFILEDVLRLVHLSDFKEEFIQALQINNQLFHRGAAVQFGDAVRDEMISELGTKWKSKETLDVAQTLCALNAGSSLYPMIDRDLGHETINKKTPLLLQHLSDEAIYQDVWIMKEMQNADPTNQSVPMSSEIEGVTVEEVAELFHLIRQRNLIRMHTFRPEFSGVELWLDQILHHQHTLEKENIRYAEMYCNPGSLNVSHNMNNFYEAQDGIIQLARGMQMSVAELTIGLDEAVEKSAEQSTYAKLLGKCMVRLSHWHKFINGNLDRGSLLIDLD